LGEFFNAPITETTTIWEDNQSAIAYSQSALVNEETKHVGLKWHFLKDHVERGTIKLRYLPIEQMLAAIFTKSLPRPSMIRDRSVILGGEDPIQTLHPVATFWGSVVSNTFQLLLADTYCKLAQIRLVHV
jgi:hypothetical protein